MAKKKKKETRGNCSCVVCQSEVTALFLKPGQDAEKLLRKKKIIKRKEWRRRKRGTKVSKKQ